MPLSTWVIAFIAASDDIPVWSILARNVEGMFSRVDQSAPASSHAPRIPGWRQPAAARKSPNRRSRCAASEMSKTGRAYVGSIEKPLYRLSAHG
jgi:hypothetical protein